ncbi:hypothetical protein ACFV9P_28110 [Streptomyces sp. NPDC059892]|uniref:hypothetical protein n=1 Tax=Streptomyces sp. NPDC059892 TaxID=3346989 RepID=UPI003649AF21
MAFPNTPLDARTELQLRGVWTDISQYVYTREPITIVQGRGDEGTRTDPGRCGITLNNRDGRFSPRNPMGPYYGALGRNTPLRISVPQAESYLALDGTPDATASTPHTGALDITGDIDIRIEATVEWLAAPAQILIGKWDSSANQRSWMLHLQNSQVSVRFSPDGIAAYSASWLLPTLPARAALRATVDVNNGNGWTVGMFWAPTLDGPWIPIGVPFAFPEVTAIFSTTAPLLIAPTSTTITPPWRPAAGRIHRAEVRSGIDGTIVASPDFRTLPEGTTSFADSAGRAWTVNSPAEISRRDYRFQGEVSSWPSRWDASGKDVWTPVEAAGILRRLGQGRKALASALARRIPTAASVLAYWPLEDQGSTTGRAYSPIRGVPPLSLTNVTWASADTLPSSNPLPVLASNNGDLPMMSGAVPAPTGPTTGWQVRWIYRLDTPNTTMYTFMRVLTTGTVAQWYIQMRDTQARVLALDANGDTVIDQPIPTGGRPYRQWKTLNLRTSQSGSTVTWVLTWHDIDGTFDGWFSSYTGTIGRVRALASPPDGFAAALDSMALGHIAVFSTTDSTAYNGALTGYSGESSVNRLNRLAVEESELPLMVVDGDAELFSELMGPQRPVPLLELLQECADTDGGILYERRDALGLVYRDRTSLEGQDPVFVLDYAAGEVGLPLEPVEDDQRVRNDITVTRAGGGSGRVVIEEGSLSVRVPEQGGVGIYDEALTLSLAVDDQAEQIAAWKAHLGTWDEARYPTIRMQLHTAPRLAADVARLRIGDMGRITNPPSWLAPGDIDFLVYGYTETLDQYTWDLVMSAAPAGPWRVGVLADPQLSRVDGELEGAQLTAAASPTATTLMVDSPIPWTTDPSDMPVTVQVGGEVVTVTSITGNVQDTFTRTIATGWGTADSGQSWTTSGGVASDYYVQGA